MKLYIYGAGGLAEEILELIKRNKLEQSFSQLIFIDDNPKSDSFCGHPVVSFESIQHEDPKGSYFIIGVGEPSTRKKLAERCMGIALTPYTLIDSEVYLPKSIRIGKGVVVSPDVFLSVNVELGDFCYLQPQCVIGHDVKLERNVIVSSHCSIAGHVTIGCDSYLGMNSSVIQGCSIGCNCAISMGTMVMRDVPDNMVAMGYPARCIGENHGIFTKK